MAPIQFVTMLDTGRAMPVNAAPDPAGNVAASRVAGRLLGHVITQLRPAREGEQRFTAHFAVCNPDAPTVPASKARLKPPLPFDQTPG